MPGFCSSHKHPKEGCTACQMAKKLNEETCPNCGMEPCNCKSEENCQNDDVPLHWYCFSYVGHHFESGMSCHGSSYTGHSKMGVTRTMIDKNKESARVTQSAVLTAVIYLGYMTRNEFLADCKK